MDLFDEGGLVDEGNTSDPVSGNETPVGSLNEEVRDDVPAQLSEGEFVLPADVVRFHGLEKIMQLRDEAKQGLQRMEDMGQMGNADEAVLPDDVPFDIDDLELDDDPVEMQVGGFTPGQTIASDVAGQFGNMQKPLTPVSPVGKPFTPTMGGFTPTIMPVQQPVPIARPVETPDFEDFLKPKEGTAPENREYINPKTGEKRFFVFIGGKSTVDIPKGFIPISQYKPEEKVEKQIQPVVQQQREEDPSRMTDEERKDQFEREQRIKDRKAAAFELGYTKEADPLKEAGKFLLGALIPGGGLLMGMDKPEKGTIMPDGSIADGEGNTFDPRTGEQIGGKGFFGMKGEAFPMDATEEQMRESGLTPASRAGLRTLIGEESIKNLIASLPEEVKVASTTMAGAGKTAGEAAVAATPDTKKIASTGVPTPERRLTGTYDRSTLLTTQPPARSDPSTMLPQIPGDPFSDRRKAGQSTRAITPDTKKIDQSGRPSTQKLDTRGISTTGRPRTKLEDAIFEQKTVRDTLAKAKQKDRKQYSKDIRSGKYNAEFAKLEKEKQNENLIRNSRPNKAGVNLAEKVGKDLAKKVEDRQGTATNVDKNTGQISYGKDHDWSKPTQTNVNRTDSERGKAIKEDRDEGGGGGGKIVCTAMNNAYGFGSFRQAIWLQHSKNMDPAYQKGYHRIFKPLVRLAYRDKKWYNKSTRYILEGIARRRTADIWLQKKGKRHFVGAIERAILEPLCYIVGKIK